MVQAVSEFIPKRMLSALCVALADITNANGYQSQPAITDDIRVLSDERGKTESMLFVSPSSMSMILSRAPLGYKLTALFSVVGQTSPGQSDPHTESMALLQDVLTRLSAMNAEARTTMGRGVTITFDGVEFDEPYLTLDDGLISWTLTVSFATDQGATW